MNDLARKAENLGRIHSKILNMDAVEKEIKQEIDLEKYQGEIAGEIEYPGELIVS